MSTKKSNLTCIPESDIKMDTPSINNNLVIFGTILSFTNSLSDMFGGKQHSLKLYNHLISKTKISNEIPIQKHVECFRLFCVNNREGILSKDYNKFIDPIAKYSFKVFIDFSQIFRLADNETKNIIWKHILTISALVDPTSNAKEILKSQVCSNETDFLTNIISKIETHITPDSNPMQAISSILQSGTFSELIGGMNDGLSDGSLDIGKLMTSVQSVVTKMNTEENSNKPDIQQHNIKSKDSQFDMMSMLGPLLSSMSLGMGQEINPSTQLSENKIDELD